MSADPLPATHRELYYRPTWQVVLAGRRTSATGFRHEDVGACQPLPSRKRLRQEFHRARQAGAHFVRLRSGFGAAGVPETIAQLRYLGHRDFVGYVAEACQLARETVGPGNRRLQPVLDMVPLHAGDLGVLGKSVDHIHYAMDAADDELLHTAAFSSFPEKRVAEQVRQLEAILTARVRVVVGLMVGIGESVESRERALRILADFRAAGGALAGVLLTPFIPYMKTEMETVPMVEREEVERMLAQAHDILPDEVRLSLQPEGRSDLLDAAREGLVDDLGYVTINRRLANGRLEGDWFTEHLGALDRFREARGEPIREDGRVWRELAETGPWPAVR